MHAVSYTRVVAQSPSYSGWGAINLNIHFHALVLDGVFAHAEERSEFNGSQVVERVFG